MGSSYSMTHVVRKKDNKKPKTCLNDTLIIKMNKIDINNSISILLREQNVMVK